MGAKQAWRLDAEALVEQVHRGVAPTAGRGATNIVLATLKLIWRRWKVFAHGLVAAQSWLLMAIAYWTAVMPVALYFKLFKPDPLDRGLGDPDAGTLAKESPFARQDIRRAQRPW